MWSRHFIRIFYEKKAVNSKAFHGYVNSLRNLCRCVCKHILKLQFNESTTKYVW